MRHKTLGMAAFLLFALDLSGCGPSGKKLCPVSGKVTFQGKSVSGGIIRFSNPEAGVDMTARLRDGAYEVVMASGAGLPEGTYHVAILPRPSRDLSTFPAGTDRPPGTKEQSPTPAAFPDIPAKYYQPSTSGLTLTVVPGGNTFNVDMRP